MSSLLKEDRPRLKGSPVCQVLDASIFVKCTLDDGAVFDGVAPSAPCLAPFSESLLVVENVTHGWAL